ncbi:hypothetical protein [Mesonia sp. K7]|uniref:hypothetical protein n=1 Tax=Mesonia sp. K7 TaxID=2218606 RepID=UPI000DAABD5F|nr:hypothetical protein [Mesonia sp. K7]PZD77697.1 hypothetical protein DNG35_07620 [Mesonia sp. K7]
MDNWEKNIKEKLEAREITPAASGWDQLSNELASAEAKRSSKKWWLGIAASFLIGILVTSFFFTLDKGSEVKVTETKPEKIENNQETTKKENLLFEEIEGEKVYTADKIEQVFPKEELLKNEKPVKGTAENHLSKTKETKTIKVLMAENSKGPQTPLQAKNIEEEVDGLLAAAQKEILTDKILKETNNSINAQALLNEVEIDLNPSLGKQIHNFIENSFSQIKSPIAFLKN